MNSTLVFVTLPTKGCVRDGKITEQALKFVAGLHRAYPEKTFLCPMIQDYQLLPYLPDVPATWEEWESKCTRLIIASDEVWVPKFEGWMESTGVQAEIKLAQDLGKRLAYIIVDH